MAFSYSPYIDNAFLRAKRVKKNNNTHTHTQPCGATFQKPGAKLFLKHKEMEAMGSFSGITPFKQHSFKHGVKITPPIQGTLRHKESEAFCGNHPYYVSLCKEVNSTLRCIRSPSTMHLHNRPRTQHSVKTITTPFLARVLHSQ